MQTTTFMALIVPDFAGLGPIRPPGPAAGPAPAGGGSVGPAHCFERSRTSSVITASTPAATTDLTSSGPFTVHVPTCRPASWQRSTMGRETAR